MEQRVAIEYLTISETLRGSLSVPGPSRTLFSFLHVNLTMLSELGEICFECVQLFCICTVHACFHCMRLYCICMVNACPCRIPAVQTTACWPQKFDLATSERLLWLKASLAQGSESIWLDWSPAVKQIHSTVSVTLYSLLDVTGRLMKWCLIRSCASWSKKYCLIKRTSQSWCEMLNFLPFPVLFSCDMYTLVLT